MAAAGLRLNSRYKPVDLRPGFRADADSRDPRRHYAPTRANDHPAKHCIMEPVI